MIKQQLFVGVGFIGLAAAVAMPAAAQEAADNEGETPAFVLSSDDDDAEGTAEVEGGTPATGEIGGSTSLSSGAIGTFSGFRSIGDLELTVGSGDLVSNADQLTARQFVDGGLVPPHPDLIVRDDVGVDGAGDYGNTLPAVVQLFLGRNSDGGVFFNCTGTIINPRTVLTAAHCVNSRSSEDYGSGAGQFTMLVSTGVTSDARVFNTINTGATYAQGGVAASSDVIIHPSSELTDLDLPFPWADVALIALNEPITDVPAMPLLLTPLDQLTHVILTGYGTNGTGDTGGTNAGNRFLRRVGENMLGAIASQADLIDGIYPSYNPSVSTIGQNSQVMYFIDFDDPNRTEADKNACTFSGTGISCPSLDAVKAIDWFGDDALPNESGTAPGDSGSPIIVDQLYGFPVVAGVLSGGYDFFRVGNLYSDISFYNPLYPFFEFISENTPYKYVSTAGGNGYWSDPEFWTQDLDPGFFIDDGTGNLVNGVPEGNEPGIYETGPKIGKVRGYDVSNGSTTQAGVLPGTPPPLPESSVLLGQGSTGFVPNNTDGIVGTAFANPAQYFDVLLTKPGAVFLDMDVEIDRLTVDGSAFFVLQDGFSMDAIIGVEQHGGYAQIEGELEAGLVALFGGRMLGSGTVDTDVFFNVAGQVAPGGFLEIGNFTIQGDYVQSSGGQLSVNLSSVDGVNTSDLLTVTGTAVLDGTLFVTPVSGQQLKFGTSFTVLTAGTVDGNFANPRLMTNAALLDVSSRVEGNDVVVEIGARRLEDVVLGSSGLRSMGTAIDTLRFSGRYAEFSDMFGVLDSASWDTLGATLASLTPTSALGQAMTANRFAQRFTGQIAQRTLALRGADHAASGFSAAGSASFAQAGVSPAQGKLGFFGSVSGSYLADAQPERQMGATEMERRNLTNAGELTLGADYQLSNTVSVGVAFSSVRNSAQSIDGFRPLEEESMAVASYAAIDLGAGFADLYFGTADQSYGLQRAAMGDFTKSYRSALASAEGYQTFIGARVGYTMEPLDDLKVGPVASLDVVRSDLGGYLEFNAGSLGLDVHDRTFTSIGAKAGAMASFDTTVGNDSTLTMFGSVAYARELGDTQDVVTANFFGAADAPFQIVNELDAEWVSVNAGAELRLSDSFSTKLNVSSDLGRGVLTNNQASVSLNWQF